MEEFLVIGVMSGSSLDGLDVCMTRFARQSARWSYALLRAETIPLAPHLLSQLRQADVLDSQSLLQLDVAYGTWIADQLREFCGEDQPQLVGLHGHTVFHEPQLGYSLQIGSGLVVANRLGIPVVDNFRTTDILLGGQGAPLVPVGEQLLLTDWDGFVNLGGIANVSIHRNALVRAWDVAPCNQIFNHFAAQLGGEYDLKGNWARSGNLNEAWLEELNALAFFQTQPPKSLSNQWKAAVLKWAPKNPEDALHTYAHFLARQLVADLHIWGDPPARVLFTGGGTFNDFLIERIRMEAQGKFEVILPEPKLIHFKEAMIFGFLGLLRYLGQINCLRSVTGASRDSVAGTLHIPGLP